MRGKVLGECRPYQIGQITHYLDDRSYLILKQLLERVGGIYTVAVYEALQQAVRQPSQQRQSVPAEEDGITLVHLDRPVRRQTQRILLTLPVTIKQAELTYHATTLDVSTEAIRLSMKRATSLQKNTQVSVDFKHFVPNQQTEKTLIDFDIIRLDHHEQRTFAVLRFHDSVGDDISQAWHNWLSQQSPAKSTNDVFHLLQSSLLRLYSQQNPSLLCWIGERDTPIVTALHSSPACAQLFMPIANLLPVVKQLLGYIEAQGLSRGFATLHAGKLIVISVDEKVRLSQLRADSPVWYFNLSPLQVNSVIYHAHYDAVAQVDAHLAEVFARDINSLKSLLELTDISESLHQLSADESGQYHYADISTTNFFTLPPVSTLKAFIRRQQSRYTVHTPVALLLNSQEHITQTNEVSIGGLSLSVNADLPVRTGMRVTLHFTRWQAQRPLLNLRSVPYEIKQIHKFAGQTELGLQRIVAQCPLAVNQFFETAITSNQHVLARREDDLLQMQYSQVYLDLLSHAPVATALFFGLDQRKKRVLQAVAGHSTFLDRLDKKLWQAISTATPRITLMLKKTVTDTIQIHGMGLYCYRAPQQPWQIVCEHELQSVTAKKLLLHRLFAAESHYVFHCRFINSKTDWLYDELDLVHQLNALRSDNAHRVKQLRQMLSSLFTVAYLTDITAITRQILID